MVGYFIAFFREAIIASYWGVSSDVDAYTVAIAIPINLFSIITISIQSIIIPIYSDLLLNKSNEDANHYACLLINSIAVFAIALVVVLELIAGPIATLFAPGFTPESHEMVVTLLRMVLPTIVVSLIIHVLVGILNVYKNFIWPALSIHILNLSIIVTIVLLHSKFGIASACFGQIIGVTLQLLFLVLFVRKHLKFSIGLNFKDSSIKETGRRVIPVIWSTGLSEINGIVNGAIASMLFVGAVASIGYATKINSVMMSFFTSAIATVIYPLYAESGAKNDYSQLNSRVNHTLSAYTFFLIPLIALVLILRKELISVAFGRGAFDMEAINITQSILGCYAPGLLFLAMRETITKVFYSLKDTTTPAKNATIGILLNVLLSVTLPFLIGVEGLAIAASLTAAFVSVRLLYLLLSKHKELGLQLFFCNLKLMIIPLFLMSLGMVLMKSFLDSSAIIVLLLCGGLGATIYLGASVLFKVPILDKLLKMILK